MQGNKVGLTAAAGNSTMLFPEPPTEVEEESNIGLLKSGKAAGPDELPPILSN